MAKPEKKGHNININNIIIHKVVKTAGERIVKLDSAPSVINIGDGFEFKVQYMKLMYAPQLTIQDQQPFIEIFDKILEIKKVDPKSDSTTLEAQIDQMVYTLYNLTPDEIAIIEK